MVPSGNNSTHLKLAQQEENRSIHFTAAAAAVEKLLCEYDVVLVLPNSSASIVRVVLCTLRTSWAQYFTPIKYCQKVFTIWSDKKIVLYTIQVSYIVYLSKCTTFE